MANNSQAKSSAGHIKPSLSLETSRRGVTAPPRCERNPAAQNKRGTGNKGKFS